MRLVVTLVIPFWFPCPSRLGPDGFPQIQDLPYYLGKFCVPCHVQLACPVRRAIFVCDIVSFGGATRHDRIQMRLRWALYQGLRRSFGDSVRP
jgi:hypothetical protein